MKYAALMFLAVALSGCGGNTFDRSKAKELIENSERFQLAQSLVYFTNEGAEKAKEQGLLVGGTKLLNSDSLRPSKLGEVLSQNLSAYDAAYLQLAVALNAPLATYDRVLASAAEKVL